MGELSSHAEYEAAKMNLEDKRRKFDQAAQGSFEDEHPYFDEIDYQLNNWRLKKAEKRLAEIENKSHEEALELNKEYERLKREVIEAVRSLRVFERSKLGMKDEA
jgi:hypothetical protein